jgi:hypothetical protein
MPDSTVLGTPRARLSGPSAPRYSRADDEEDAQLARVLITSWSLVTGRTLRSDVPPRLLTEDELIAFWADDADGAAGRDLARAGLAIWNIGAAGDDGRHGDFRGPR